MAEPLRAVDLQGLLLWMSAFIAFNTFRCGVSPCCRGGGGRGRAGPGTAAGQIAGHGECAAACRDRNALCHGCGSRDGGGDSAPADRAIPISLPAQRPARLRGDLTSRLCNSGVLSDLLAGQKHAIEACLHCSWCCVHSPDLVIYSTQETSMLAALWTPSCGPPLSLPGQVSLSSLLMFPTNEEQLVLA